MKVLFCIAAGMFAIAACLLLASLFVPRAIRKPPEFRKGIRRGCRIVLLLCAGVMVLSGAGGQGKTALTTTTIGQLSQELSALGEKQPDRLIFTESVSGRDTFCVEVDDPAMAKSALDILLSTSVSRLGCQVDMAQMRYEEYCFFFGGEAFRFTFLPHSYFCYNGKDYELGESRLPALCQDLHELAEGEGGPEG